MYDTYSAAEKINEGTLESRQAKPVTIKGFTVIVLFNAIAFLAATVIGFISLQFAPAGSVGDEIFYVCLILSGDSFTNRLWLSIPAGRCASAG